MRTITFTGTYGIVALFDRQVDNFAAELAKKHAPKSEYLVELAHVTLYHGPFKEVPESFVAGLLSSFSPQKLTVHLDLIRSYGGKFLFWDFPSIPLRWKQLHYEALSLSAFLEPQAEAHAEREKLDISDPTERVNLLRFRHPLVGTKFRPHITLAYDSGGIVSPEGIRERRRFDVERIAFAHIGQNGRVDDVLNI